MRRLVLHSLLAALALLYLAAMVVSGAMPVQRQFERFEAKGVLKLPPDGITRVELSRGTQRVTLLRTGETQWATPDGVNIGAAGLQVSKAVQIMHNSGPVREIEAAELAGSDPVPFGLDPPRPISTRRTCSGDVFSNPFASKRTSWRWTGIAPLATIAAR